MKEENKKYSISTSKTMSQTWTHTKA